MGCGARLSARDRESHGVIARAELVLLPAGRRDVHQPDTEADEGRLYRWYAGVQVERHGLLRRSRSVELDVSIAGPDARDVDGASAVRDDAAERDARAITPQEGGLTDVKLDRVTRLDLMGPAGLDRLPCAAAGRGCNRDHRKNHE